MKTAVLIPSHIYYFDQLSRLDKALESLSCQTVVPDIFVSISFANNTYKSEFSTLLRKYSKVNFKLSTHQKFQMEHLGILSKYVKNYDMIMFCDDDDTYLPMRVEKFVNAFKDCSDKSGNRRFGGVKEIESIKDKAAEYWSYGIPPSLLDEFFNRIKGYEDLMRHKFADMYLRNYLSRTSGDSIIFATFIGPTMYKYTTTNPNSICERGCRQPEIEKIKSNITLDLICVRPDGVRESMKNISTPGITVNDVVPNADRIKSLTDILYK